MAEKDYYMESDAVDMCIERMFKHQCTMTERALIAMNYMFHAYPDTSRLIEAILYGNSYFDEIENMRLLDEAERKEVDEILKELEAKDATDDV